MLDVSVSSGAFLASLVCLGQFAKFFCMSIEISKGQLFFVRHGKVGFY